MLKKFIVGVALVLATAASKPPKIDVQTLIVNYVAGNEGLNGDMVPAVGETHLPDFIRLVGVAKRHGVQVFGSHELTAQRLWGFYSETGHYIVLNLDNLDTDGAVAVLAHELGHVFTFPLVRGNEGDVVAQAVSYIVCTRVGIDTAAPTYGYYNDLEGKDAVLGDLMRNAKLIDRAANELTQEMALVEVK
jgi:hypothetical protein